MKTLKFKTNITCGGCLEKVTPVLNSIKGINKWEIDQKNPNNLLTVETEKVSSTLIIEKIKELGYNAVEWYR